ncbi:MAG: DUF5041 domain-containing protein [Paramuribaculum sp.]|nr:DUF5041 domain-containing protein [Paramuribaculum sp.]
MSVHIKLLAFLLTTLITVSAEADVLKPVDSTLSDYAALLRDAGYELYSFDISDLIDNQYTITVTVREYEGDSLINDNVSGWPRTFSNRTMLSEFSEEDRNSIKREDMYDAEKGIYTADEKINIGFLPETDNIKGGKNIRVSVNLPQQGSTIIQLELHPIFFPGSPTPLYRYSTRPFTTNLWKENEFTPLVLLGSAWYDQKFNVIRFCGESEIAPDLSSDILKDTPHFYVIGVTVTKQ